MTTLRPSGTEDLATGSFTEPLCFPWLLLGAGSSLGWVGGALSFSRGISLYFAAAPFALLSVPALALLWAGFLGAGPEVGRGCVGGGRGGGGEDH